MATNRFTEGKIFKQLLMFAVPVVLALFLQSLYGAADLLIVGQYGTNADVSAVSTGAHIMQTVTNVIAGLAMGTTILLGQYIGQRKDEEAGHVVGVSSVFFVSLAAVLSVILIIFNRQVAEVMNAPAEAFEQTCQYTLICSAGMIFITAYNLLSSLFRGIGNSRVPLLTVTIAAVINIFVDLWFVKGLGMGARGAAYATVLSQAISVLVSIALIRKISLPFTLKKKDFVLDFDVISRVCKFGFPIALADALVGMSFLVIYAIVNNLGLMASAGVGVAGKVTGFILLIPSAFGQSLAAFVAQNFGARKMDRAHKALKYGIISSLVVGLVMAYISFFHGDILCGIFSKDPEVIAQGWDYMKAFSFDCILTSFFFCLTGYFNGCGETKFVMAQSIIGAFGVRVPMSYFMSKVTPVSLFYIGLATPASSLLQTILCLGYMLLVTRKMEEKIEHENM